MPINFPDSPSVNDTYTVGDRTWVWDGTTWTVIVGGVPTSISEFSVTNDLTVDTDTLHVDSTNDRVGIGTASPAYDLDVSGEVNASTDMRIAGVSLDGLIRSAMPVGSVIPFAGASSPDASWLVCDGSAVSRTTYASLFAVLGTTYGVGDGSTTFNLPNMKGRVPVGVDPTDGDFDNLGDSGGEKSHILITSEMPSHSHAFTGSSSSTSNQSNNHTHNSNTMSNPGNHEHSVYTRGTLGGGGRFIYGDYIGGSGATHWNPNSWGTITGSAFANEAIGLGNGGHTHTYTTSGINSNHTHPFTPSGTNSIAGADVAHNNLQPYVALNYIIKA